jgi:hypothetical protein
MIDIKEGFDNISNPISFICHNSFTQLFRKDLKSSNNHFFDHLGRKYKFSIIISFFILLNSHQFNINLPKK